MPHPSRNWEPASELNEYDFRQGLSLYSAGNSHDHLPPRDSQDLGGIIVPDFLVFILHNKSRMERAETLTANGEWSSVERTVSQDLWQQATKRFEDRMCRGGNDLQSLEWASSHARIDKSVSTPAPFFPLHFPPIRDSPPLFLSPTNRSSGGLVS